MKWTMLVERWPGGSTVEEAPTGDRLKVIASDIWKREGRQWLCVSKVRFTIYDPGRAEWQTCTRFRGGSWRAKWTWCSSAKKDFLLKGESE